MRRTLAAVALLSITTLTACGDNGTGSSDPPNLAGTWTSTAIVVAPVSNPSETEDLYAEGFRLTFTFQANGNYTIVTTLPGEPTDTNSGTYSQSGSTLTLTESGVGGDVNEITVTTNGSNATFVVNNIDFEDVLSNMTVTVTKS
jgi:hypothetical protein